MWQFFSARSNSIDSCLMDWMVEIWRNKIFWPFGNFFFSLNKQMPQSVVEEPHTVTTAWRVVPILVASLVTHCSGMAFNCTPGILLQVTQCGRVGHSGVLMVFKCSIEMTSNYVFPGMEMSPHTTKLPPPKYTNLSVQLNPPNESQWHYELLCVIFLPAAKPTNYIRVVFLQQRNNLTSMNSVTFCKCYVSI